ncbi:MAG: 50S ribosomal protein L9 [Pelagibacterales bacterium]|nr:50S ribosomal protein L9 [Pelagibacterales bacterium]PPR17148.1 MAG: 50S ribosomal protein L9 [Alphaproteobacteria bacterium MarineAlpha9_Bin3]|tara:strand:+ start:7585 stop:8205 length:621 start_codon:yes stop_codon:yes gene_type:complete
MEVILLERIEKIGKLGDVVKVKDGFARNYLLPQNKALRANKENLSVYEKEKEKYEKLNKEKLSAAEKIASNMKDVSINIIKQASDSGQLYGSVSTRDISDELNNQGHKIEKRQIVLKSVIKTVGQHEVRVVIHPEHIINIKVNIGRTLEELTFKAEEIENLAEENVTKKSAESFTEDKPKDDENLSGKSADAKSTESLAEKKLKDD